MRNVYAVVLAAAGTEINPVRPRALGEVLFRPAVLWVADALARAGIGRVMTVLGSGGDEVRALLPPDYAPVWHNGRGGDGHAVAAACDAIRESGAEHVAVLHGDAPFVTPDDLRAAYDMHKNDGNAVTVFSARLPDPDGFGRLARVRAVVRNREADRAAVPVDGADAVACWFDAAFLLEYFDKSKPGGRQGDYSLAEAVSAAARSGRAGVYAAHPDTVLRAGDRRTLARLNELARRYVIDTLLDGGVDIPFAGQVTVDTRVRVAPGATLLPGTVLRGETAIGPGCVIGPNTMIEDSTLGAGCHIVSSYIEGSALADHVSVGPMSRIRPGCRVGSRVKVGNFVELKNSVIGDNTAVAHLTYVGDADVGARVNFGCGVVLVNYDGESKHRTQIGDGSFIGCNSNLISPVKIGERAYLAAATNVTGDVPAEALAIGRARMEIKRDWNKDSKRFRKGK